MSFVVLQSSRVRKVHSAREGGTGSADLSALEELDPSQFYVIGQQLQWVKRHRDPPLAIEDGRLSTLLGAQGGE